MNFKRFQNLKWKNQDDVFPDARFKIAAKMNRTKNPNHRELKKKSGNQIEISAKKKITKNGLR